MRRAPVLCALCALCALPAATRAGGMDYPDNGTAAVGRGGAFVAKADDGTAIYYNPAGLSAQGGWRLLVDSNFVNHNVSFQRVTPGGGGMDAPGGTPVGEVVENQAPPFIAPFGTISYGFTDGPAKGLTLAIGAYGPPSVGRYQFNEPKGASERAGGVSATAPGAALQEDGDASHLDPGAPNRYMLVENDITIAYPTLAVGYRVVDWLSLGVSLQYVYSDVHFSQVAWNYPNGRLRNLVDPDASCPTVDRSGGASGCAFPNDQSKELTYWDALATVDVTGDPGVTGIFGAMVGPFEGVQLGVSFRPPVTLHGTGTLKTAETPMTRDFGVAIDGDATELEFTLPPVFRAGLRFDLARLLPGADVEVDYVFEGWSTVDAIHVSPDLTTTASSQFVLDANGGEPVVIRVPQIEVTKNWKDTHAVRVGGDVPVFEPLTLRVGYMYETSAMVAETVALDFVNFERHVLTAGASVHVTRYADLVLGYARVIQPDVTITTSDVRQLTIDPDQTGNIVGNGSYESSYDVLSAGVSVRFSEI